MATQIELNKFIGSKLVDFKFYILSNGKKNTYGYETTAKFDFYVDKIIIKGNNAEVHARFKVQEHGDNGYLFGLYSGIGSDEFIRLPEKTNIALNVPIPKNNKITCNIEAKIEVVTETFFDISGPTSDWGYDLIYTDVIASQKFEFDLSPYLINKFHATQSSDTINDYTAYIYDGSLKKIKEAYITDASGNLKKVV